MFVSAFPKLSMIQMKQQVQNTRCALWIEVCCNKEDSNLVDSASSHTLVSKIKPCMSKYKSFTLKLRMAHYISYSLFDSPLLLG
jgi:hypothetical protein